MLVAGLIVLPAAFLLKSCYSVHLVRNLLFLSLRAAIIEYIGLRASPSIVEVVKALFKSVCVLIQLSCLDCVLGYNHLLRGARPF